MRKLYPLSYLKGGMIWTLITALCVISAPVLHADEVQRSEPTVIDRTYMEDQRQALDEVARRYLGRQFNGNKDNDLELMQIMLDRRLVRRDQRELLQAMGFVLGDLLAKEEGLKWIIYTDAKGRSRALEIPLKDDVIFPVTMISRRYEVGAEVDVRAVYEKAQDAVADIRRRIYLR